MKRAREASGWTQADLAAALSALTGEAVPRETVAGWERRGGTVPRARLASVREALELPLKYLAEDVERPYLEWLGRFRQEREYLTSRAGALPAHAAADAFTSAEQRRIAASITPEQAADAVAQASVPELLQELGFRHGVAAGALGVAAEGFPNVPRARRVLSAAGVAWGPQESPAAPGVLELGDPSGRQLDAPLRILALRRVSVVHLADEVASRIAALEATLSQLGGPLDPATEFRATEIVSAVLDDEDWLTRQPEYAEGLSALARRALLENEISAANDK